MALDIYSLPDKILQLAEDIFPEQERFETWYNNNEVFKEGSTEVDWDKMVEKLKEYRKNEDDGDEM